MVTRTMDDTGSDSGQSGELDQTLPAPSHSETDQTLPSDAPGSAQPADSHVRVRSRSASRAGTIGRYEVVEEHARGGLGRVLRARDVDLDREVAVKELLQGGNLAEERFLREARITAQLQHPAIVPVHEVGLRPDGRPYYSMKLISGRALKAAVEDAKRFEDRLALIANVQAVADAMAYAHARRVIHRDLKPANIICGEFGETVVIDWGLAKDLDEPDDVIPTLADPYRSPAKGGLTVTGTVLGTPAYMPPEQARGEHVDERADVYALGAMLYYVLAGEAPYSRSVGDSVVAEVISGPPSPIRAREPRVPADLAAIAEKAMSRDPADRYPSAKELAEDLRRYLTGGLVGARSYTARELAARWLRRHKAIATVAAAALVAVASIGGLSVSRVIAERDSARKARAAAEQARDTAEQRKNELILAQAESALETDPTETIAWLKTYPADGDDWAAVQRIAADAQSRGVATHVMRGHRGSLYALDVSPDGKLAATFGRDDTVWIWDVDAGTGIPAAKGVHWDGGKLAFSPDGQSVAVGTNDGGILLVAPDGSSTRKLTGHTGMPWYFEYSGDGKALFSAAGDGTTRLWDPRTGESRVVADYGSPISLARLSPNGEAAAACDFEQNLFITDVATGDRSRIGSCERWDVESYPMAFSRDGAHLAAGDGAGNVLLWDVAHRRARSLRGPAGNVNDVAFSPDGAVVAAAHSGDATHVYRVDTGDEIESLPTCAYKVAFSDDGSWLACAGETGAVVLRDRGGGGTWQLRGHGAAVLGLEFLPGNRGVVSTGQSGDVRVWRLPRVTPIVSQFGSSWIQSMAYSPDGRWIATGDRAGALRLTAAGSRESRLLHDYATPLFDVGFVTGEHSTIAVADANGSVHAWDLAGETGRTLGAHGGVAAAVDASPNGNLFASAGLDGEVRLWDLSAGTDRSLDRREAPAREISFSPDGATLASADAEGGVHLLELASGANRTLSGHSGAVATVRFSPDGTHIASAGSDGTARVWNVAAGSSAILARHEDVVRDVVWLPDGSGLLSVGGDGITMLTWVDGSREPTAWRGHSELIWAAAVSPDGAMAATVGEDGIARVWSLETGGNAVLRGPGHALTRVAFSPDGEWLATVGVDGALEQWAVRNLGEPPVEPAALRAWLAATSSSSLQGRSAVLSR